MDSSADAIESLRQRIDLIDGQLVELLNERAKAAREVGRAKLLTGSPVFVPHRETQVLERIRSLNRGPMPEAALAAIWREIMSAAIALEKPLTICHFGSPGAFTYQAARLKFGESASYVGVEAINTVFKEVERGHADYGVVPIENSLDGGINDTIDACQQTSLRIINEMSLRIRHHLMGKCVLGEVRKVFSRPTVFSQCRRWLAENLPGVELVETISTTQAAGLAADQPNSAAIGDADVAHRKALPILAADIEDSTTNTTRFIVLAKPDHAAARTGNDKTSLFLAVRDRPGALYESLIPFHRRGINLCRIESRPSRSQAWEYVFCIDVFGHESDPMLREALTDLKDCTSSLRVLGSYPRADRPLNDT